MAFYEKDIDYDFPALVGNEVNLNELKDIIDNDVNITTPLQFIEQNGSIVKFKFDSTLPGAEETAFDNVINAYNISADYGNDSTEGKPVIINVIKDVKTNGTRGGTFLITDTSIDDENKDSNGNYTWMTRDLNTIIGDNIFVTLSNNIFTLPIGVYYISANAPGFKVLDHQIRLKNRTASTVSAVGTSEYANAEAQTRSFLSVFVSLSASTDFELQHRAQKKRDNDGLGRACGFGNNEIYSVVEITKIQ